MRTQKTLMDPNDMLPDLPAMDSVTTMDKPAEDISKLSKTNKTLTRSGVTELIATKETSADDTPGVNKQLDEPNIPTRAGVTEIVTEIAEIDEPNITTRTGVTEIAADIAETDDVTDNVPSIESNLDKNKDQER